MSKHGVNLMSRELMKELCRPIPVPGYYVNKRTGEKREKLKNKFVAKENDLNVINVHFNKYMEEKNTVDLYRAALHFTSIEVVNVIFKQDLIKPLSSIIKRMYDEINAKLLVISSKNNINDDKIYDSLLFSKMYLKTDIELLDYIETEISTQKSALEWRYVYVGTALIGLVLLVGGLLVGPERIAKSFNSTKTTAIVALVGVGTVGSITGGYAFKEIATKFFHLTELSRSQKISLRQNMMRKKAELLNEKNSSTSASELEHEKIIELSSKEYKYKESNQKNMLFQPTSGDENSSNEKQNLMKQIASLTERLEKLSQAEQSREQKKIYLNNTGKEENQEHVLDIYDNKKIIVTEQETSSSSSQSSALFSSSNLSTSLVNPSILSSTPVNSKKSGTISPQPLPSSATKTTNSSTISQSSTSRSIGVKLSQNQQSLLVSLPLQSGTAGLPVLVNSLSPSSSSSSSTTS